MSASVLAWTGMKSWTGLKKRRPPEGGLSLGRKRPKEGMCDVSHRSNIALHRSKGKRIFSWHVSHARISGLATGARGARARDELAPQQDVGVKDVGVKDAGVKKEAARRRP